MADFSDDAMKRLERLEGDTSGLRGAVIQISEILVESSERTSAGFRGVYAELGSLRSEFSELRGEVNGLRGEVNGLRGEVNGLRGQVDGLREEMRETRDAMTSRLDRLIAVTIQERTMSAERLASIERRLDRLERHAGF